MPDTAVATGVKAPGQADPGAGSPPANGAGAADGKGADGNGNPNDEANKGQQRTVPLAVLMSERNQSRAEIEQLKAKLSELEQAKQEKTGKTTEEDEAIKELQKLIDDRIKSFRKEDDDRMMKVQEEQGKRKVSERMSKDAEKYGVSLADFSQDLDAISYELNLTGVPVEVAYRIAKAEWIERNEDKLGSHFAKKHGEAEEKRAAAAKGTAFGGQSGSFKPDGMTYEDLMAMPARELAKIPKADREKIWAKGPKKK